MEPTTQGSESHKDSKPSLLMETLYMTAVIISEKEAEMIIKIRKKAKISNQYNQAPNPTKGTTLESDKHKKTSLTREPEVSSFPADDLKAAMNRQDSMTGTSINNKKNPQKKHHLGTVSIFFYWRA